MNPDGWIVLAILAAAIVAFASNRLRVDAVGLGVLLALAVSGILTAGEAVAGFSDSSVLMIGGLFIIGEALVTTGVAAALGAWLARVGHGSETRLIVLLMLVVASIGAFMSSTGIVAIFIPIVLGLVAKTGASRTRLMMPLSVAALISGLLTLIATPPNLVVSAALTSRGLDALGFFELTPIGMAVLAVAIIYMVTAGRRLLDRPEPKADQAGVSFGEFLASYGLIDQLRALRIEPGSSLIGRTVGEAKVRTRYGVTLVAIARQRGTTSGVLPALADTVMRSGDLLAVAAPADLLDRFAEAEHLRVEPIDDRLRAAAGQEVGVAEVMLAPDASLIGKTLREGQFRSRRGLTVLAIKHRGHVVDGNLIDTPLNFGDLMLVAGGWPLIARLQEDPGEFVVLRLPQELKSIAPARARAPIALGILAAMIAIMTAGLLSNVIAVLLAALAVVGTGCVAAKERVPERRLVDARVDRRYAAAGDSARQDRGDGGDGERPHAFARRPRALRDARRAVFDYRSRRPVHLQHRNGRADRAGGDRHRPGPRGVDACVRGHRRRRLLMRLRHAGVVAGEHLGPGARPASATSSESGLPLLMLALIVTVAMVGVLYPISSPQG